MDGFREFTTVADMNAFYRDLRARNAALVPPSPSPPRWREQEPRKVLEQPPEPTPAPVPWQRPISRIILAVCAEWDIAPSQLRAKRRTQDCVTPRQVVMHLAKNPSTSFPSIARSLGLQDHTTVVHGIRAVELKIKEDPALAERVARVRALLEQESP